MVPAMRSILFSHIKLKQREFSCREDTTDLLIYTDFISTFNHHIHNFLKIKRAQITNIINFIKFIEIREISGNPTIFKRNFHKLLKVGESNSK